MDKLMCRANRMTPSNAAQRMHESSARMDMHGSIACSSWNLVTQGKVWVRFLYDSSINWSILLASYLLTCQDVIRCVHILLVLTDIKLSYYSHIVTGVKVKLCRYSVKGQNFLLFFFLFFLFLPSPPKRHLVKMISAFPVCYFNLQVPRNINTI